MLVLAVGDAGEVVAFGHRMFGVLQVEDLKSILVSGDEDERPTDFMIVREVAPVCRPRADRRIDILPLATLPVGEIPDAKRSILVLRLSDRVLPIRRWRERVGDVLADARIVNSCLGVSGFVTSQTENPPSPAP